MSALGEMYCLQWVESGNPSIEYEKALSNFVITTECERGFWSDQLSTKYLYLFEGDSPRRPPTAKI